jgi:hypothetical protein
LNFKTAPGGQRAFQLPRQKAKDKAKSKKQKAKSKKQKAKSGKRKAGKTRRRIC